MKNNLNANPENIVLNEKGLPAFTYASFAIDSVEARKALYNAINGDAGSVSDNEGKDIAVQDVVISKVSLTDDNGEFTENPRVTLITPDGDRYSSASWGVFRSIIAISEVFGTLHFDDPITIIAKKVKTKKGHTFKLDLK